MHIKTSYNYSNFLPSNKNRWTLHSLKSFWGGKRSIPCLNKNSPVRIFYKRFSMYFIVYFLSLKLFKSLMNTYLQCHITQLQYCSLNKAAQYSCKHFKCSKQDLACHFLPKTCHYNALSLSNYSSWINFQVYFHL